MKRGASSLLIRVEQRGFVDVEKVPSEKGPPRKVYCLNAQGRDYLDEFWRTSPRSPRRSSATVQPPCSRT
jgi:DNA-binding PadR family transcriptional regulator